MSVYMVYICFLTLQEYYFQFWHIHCPYLIESFLKYYSNNKYFCFKGAITCTTGQHNYINLQCSIFKAYLKTNRQTFLASKMTKALKSILYILSFNANESRNYMFI